MSLDKGLFIKREDNTNYDVFGQGGTAAGVKPAVTNLNTAQIHTIPVTVAFIATANLTCRKMLDG
ncbi:hypothetical protein COT51_00795 [candidate division WWE3 bacterium CG08_land_8_20_14_0_20_41_15]|uniref:Uncharacterized protein n=1 Tax=candidate division WWE3 bacterium CG08_land_8_20_14_0_20_41_15 TaxID=1975086 RepID=A0A2H0XA43_UNCKA|nr:MAG: hypothetical protein COT51_00795 [candidate division WWE3 bacterium CG08_land_8_20_14_0_20_41_15]